MHDDANQSTPSESTDGSRHFLAKHHLLMIHAEISRVFYVSRDILDEAMLESALAQPRARYGGVWMHSSLFEQAAAYLYHLTLNHPFKDANDATALAATLVFMRLNGYEIEDSGEELAEFVYEMVRDRHDKQWVARHLEARARKAA